MSSRRKIGVKKQIGSSGDEPSEKLENWCEKIGASGDGSSNDAEKE